MKVKIFFIAFMIILPFAAKAQKVDYLKIRDELVVLTCGGPKDSADVFGSIRRLETFDTTKIKKNIHLYYLDLGNYYWLAGASENQTYADKAITALNKALFHEPNNSRALWDLAFIYGFHHECDKAKYYFNEYHKNVPKAYETEDSAQQEIQLLAKCESKN